MEPETLTQTQRLQSLGKYIIRPKLPDWFKVAHRYATSGQKNSSTYMYRAIDRVYEDITNEELIHIASAKKYYEMSLYVYLAETVFYGLSELTHKKGYKQLIKMLEHKLIKNKEIPPRDAKSLIKRLTA